MLYVVRHEILFRSLYSLFFVDHFIVKGKNSLNIAISLCIMCDNQWFHLILLS